MPGVGLCALALNGLDCIKSGELRRFIFHGLPFLRPFLSLSDSSVELARRSVADVSLEVYLLIRGMHD